MSTAPEENIMDTTYLDIVALANDWELATDMGCREYRKGRRYITITSNGATGYEPKVGDGPSRLWTCSTTAEVATELAR